MSDKQFLSILGFYNYDASVFDNLQLPDGINKELVIDNILLDNAELSLIYTDLDFMRYAIGSWSRTEQEIWNRLNKAFNEEYNPIWNVDENTKEVREIDRTGDDTRDVTNSSNANSNTTNSSTNSSTTTDDGSSSSSSSSSNTNTNTNTNDTTSLGTTKGEIKENGKSNEIGSHNEKITETFTRSRGGNIGVTKSTELIESELEVRPKLNIYKYISNSFKKRFCNMIY